jgi:hypothetical protein
MKYQGATIHKKEEQGESVTSEFTISPAVSAQIYNMVISSLMHLIEIDSAQSEDFLQYISIFYTDGTKKFYKYNADFCSIFDTVWKLNPKHSNKSPSKKATKNNASAQTDNTDELKNKITADSIIWPISMFSAISLIVFCIKDPLIYTSTWGMLGWFVSLLSYQLVSQLLAYLSGYIFIKKKNTQKIWLNYIIWTFLLNFGNIVELIGI